MDPKQFEIRCREVADSGHPRPCGRCDRTITSNPVRSYKRGQVVFPGWVDHCSVCDLWRDGEHSGTTLWLLRQEVTRSLRQRRALDSNRRLPKEPQSPTIETAPTWPESGSELQPVVLQDDHECLIVEYKRL